jgi:release factor glutamine methyltransferase
VTISVPRLGDVAAYPGVYAPQHDSHLLIEAMYRTTAVAGRSVVDLCTGSGVVAIAAAQSQASPVSAWDISPRAIRCTRDNAADAEVCVDARVGRLHHAVRLGPYDVVLCNPPCVPTPPWHDDQDIPADANPTSAWDAGADGRLVLDQLCERAVDLMAGGGTMLLVQSEFAGIEQTVRSLRSSGLATSIAASRRIPFGPVLTARADWLRHIGALSGDRREEELVVIRADKI